MAQPPTEDLAELFERTRYETPYGSIHVNQELPVGILHWMDDRSYTTLAVLGAENPQGKPASTVDNDAAHARLEAQLNEDSWLFLESRGVLEDWSERHVVTIGCTLDQALAMARRFDQAAIVWCERDGCAEIIWC